MKRSILASLMLALTLASAAVMAAPRPTCRDASKRETACRKVPCRAAPCRASAKGGQVRRTKDGKAVRLVKKGRPSASCCAMPCRDGGACCSGAACCG